MNPAKNKLSIVKIYSLTFKTLKEQPRVFLPFVIFIALELAALLFVFLIPRAPLRPIFGPIITAFWGDKFLHYPANFLLLDKLAFLSKLVLAVVFGSLLSAMAVLLLQEAYAKKQPQFKRSFLVSLKKFASLFLIVLVVTALFYFSIKLFTFGLVKYFTSGHKKLLFLGPRLWLGPILIAFNFIISALIQSFFIYAIPFLML